MKKNFGRTGKRPTVGCDNVIFRRDPRGTIISVSFWAEIAANKCGVKSGDDADDVKWFSIKTLPMLAFDHAQIIKTALKIRKRHLARRKAKLSCAIW